MHLQRRQESLAIQILGIGQQGSTSSNIVRMNVRLSLSLSLSRSCALVFSFFLLVNRESRKQLVNPVISLAATIASHFLLQLSRDNRSLTTTPALPPSSREFIPFYFVINQTPTDSHKKETTVENE